MKVRDLISRQAAVDATCAETVSTNPEHFKSSKKFISFMDDIYISDFGRWQWANGFNTALVAIKIKLEKLPSAEPERLTDDDFETIRIHLSAYKEKLSNQHRWKEAEEYQRIIDRFMSFASAQLERKKGKWIDDGTELGCCCSECGVTLDDYFYGALYEVRLDKIPNFCPNCGSYNGGEQE